MKHKMDRTRTWRWGHGLGHPEDGKQTMTARNMKTGAQGIQGVRT